MGNSRLLCEIIFNLSVYELLGKKSNISLSTFINNSGCVEVIWFPFTEKPWLKVWIVTPTKPFWVKEVTSPYNYPITDNIPEVLSELIGNIQNAQSELTQLLGKALYSLASTSINLTLIHKIWA